MVDTFRPVTYRWGVPYSITYSYHSLLLFHIIADIYQYLKLIKVRDWSGRSESISETCICMIYLWIYTISPLHRNTIEGGTGWLRGLVMGYSLSFLSCLYNASPGLRDWKLLPSDGCSMGYLKWVSWLSFPVERIHIRKAIISLGSTNWHPFYQSQPRGQGL